MPDGETSASEEKLNATSNKLTELEDMQLVNKLDIINLKNEIEKLKLTVSVPSPETLQNIRELGKLAEHVEDFKNLKGMTKNIEKLMVHVEEIKPEGLDEMIRVVDDIDKRTRKLEAGGLGIKPEEAEEYAGMMNELKAGFKDLPKGAKGVLEFSKQLEKLRLMVEENARRLLELSRAKRAERIIKVREEPARPAKVVKPQKAPAKKAVEKPAVKKPGITKCTECGAGLVPHAKFCRKCGTKME